MKLKGIVTALLLAMPIGGARAVSTVASPRVLTGSFGSPGHFTVATDFDLSFNYVVSTNDVHDNLTLLNIAPAIDYFVADHLSLGAAAQLGISGLNSGNHTVTIGLSPRVGYDIPLTEQLSLWPKAGLGLLWTGGKQGGFDSSDWQLQLNLYAPLLLHITPSLFVGLGPALDWGFWHRIKYNGNSNDGSRDITLGIRFVLGGYL